ncbi:MAG: hypothetical protein A2782_01965 [Candidatus Blackburnbacteria bacterium RIFCSPHIGHO2_01_FULL_43_15b]|uniref:Uncharacterized protein n=1 Tax=Candidatus Blackburnbacteria bacterium RIFCSPHIGHO2_01_FULL_43_15b TaxID=1797513 RepID=A0A1G1UXZ3_9BACT|nr:MAG: hypothetical protein A2782_01965 [Candidatus Blackburnbacteria bacterium RIFCSPHIGHO2_01_FULL_43_15b]
MSKPRNINFRQTPKEFRSQSRASVFARVKRNLPYSAYHFSKEKFVYFRKKMTDILKLRGK